MYLDSTLENLMQTYPQEVGEVMDKLKKGKSHCKDASPEDLTWGYKYGIQAPKRHVLTVDEFCETVAGLRAPEGPLTLAEIKAGLLVCISGRIGRWKGCSSLLGPTPQEILDYYERMGHK